MTDRKTPLQFAGYWRITEMEVWAPDYLDLVVPAFIAFEGEMMGQFQFGTVRGWIDCRYGERDRMPAVEFSWQGQSDTDDSCGRGWGVLRDGRLEGRLFIHCGDDSWFHASRATPPASAARQRKQAVKRTLDGNP